MFVIFSSDMVEILDKDRTDEEALSYALDTLSNICSPEEFEEEIVDSRPVQDMSRPRCEKFAFFLLSLPQNERKIHNYVFFDIIVNFTIQKLKSKHSSLKKYTN